MLQFDVRITVREILPDFDESVDQYDTTREEDDAILLEVERRIEEDCVVLLKNKRSFECGISWITRVK